MFCFAKNEIAGALITPEECLPCIMLIASVVRALAWLEKERKKNEQVHIFGWLLLCYLGTCYWRVLLAVLMAKAAL